MRLVPGDCTLDARDCVCSLRPGDRGSYLSVVVKTPMVHVLMGLKAERLHGGDECSPRWWFVERCIVRTARRISAMSSSWHRARVCIWNAAPSLEWSFRSDAMRVQIMCCSCGTMKGASLTPAVIHWLLGRRRSPRKLHTSMTTWPLDLDVWATNSHSISCFRSTSSILN